MQIFERGFFSQCSEIIEETKTKQKKYLVLACLKVHPFKHLTSDFQQTSICTFRILE